MGEEEGEATVSAKAPGEEEAEAITVADLGGQGMKYFIFLKTWNNAK